MYVEHSACKLKRGKTIWHPNIIRVKKAIYLPLAFLGSPFLDAGSCAI